MQLSLHYAASLTTLFSTCQELSGLTFRVDSHGTVLIITLLDILALDILGLDILGLGNDSLINDATQGLVPRLISRREVLCPLGTYETALSLPMTGEDSITCLMCLRLENGNGIVTTCLWHICTGCQVNTTKVEEWWGCEACAHVGYMGVGGGARYVEG